MTREAVAWSLVAILASSAAGLALLMANRVIDNMLDTEKRVKTMEIIHASEIVEYRRYVDSLDHPGPRR